MPPDEGAKACHVQVWPAELRHPFRIVAFDWDGTAVMGRLEDASVVRGRIEQLLVQGVYIVVITGTNFNNVDRQLSALITAPYKQRLYVCTNRGSEVYGFSEESEPRLIWRREATPREDRLLTAVADTIKGEVEARTGQRVDVVYDRLNRRKIDLIPEPEWKDPPKSAIGDLLQAVQKRLMGAGIAGGIAEVFQRVQEVSRQLGLRSARLTSDVKHIEVGLTDKGDSISWMMRELAGPLGIPAADILVGGDEFGPIAGFEGSDHLMVTPAARGAVFVSVGVEPEGVPTQVIHLGGGPPCFRALLDQQIALHALHPSPGLGSEENAHEAVLDPFIPTADPRWHFVEAGFDPLREHEMESIFAVANGYLGTRGSLAEGTEASAPATLIAGLFDAWPHEASIPQLVVAPQWEKLALAVDGNQLRMDSGEILDHRRVIDLRRGVTLRFWRHRDRQGRVTQVHYLKFASLANRHLVAQSVATIPENYSARLAALVAVDARVVNANGVQHLTAVEAQSRNGLAVVSARTAGTGRALAVAFATCLLGSDEPPLRETVTEDGLIGCSLSWTAQIDSPYRVDRLATFFTSRESTEPAEDAVRTLQALEERTLEELIADHGQIWRFRWNESDVQVVGDALSQRALHFALFHLIGAVNPEDEYVSIGARSLTGQSYLGHVFWDTEVFLLPFYTFTHPPAARALLMYRYHTLPAARRKARDFGYRGALWAWESADSGEETTPPMVISPTGEVVPVLSGLEEHHISADIPYAIWQYWRATADEPFLCQAGAEMIIEAARFWASRATPGPGGRYHICRVVGPDEYHESVDDNAFTNVMARWTLERGLEVAALLRERWPGRWGELVETLSLTAAEEQLWRTVADGLVTGFDPQSSIYEQFAGYFSLEEIDLSAYEPRTVPMDVLLGRERTQRSRVVKQADVVMLMALLWDDFPPAVRRANFRYYEPRTGHGSSLSPGIHALVAARLDDPLLAEKYFRQAANVDLSNNMGNAAGGVHIAAAGSLWQAAVMGIGGMELRDDGLGFAPHLLPRWRQLSFPVQWRGRRLRVVMCREPATVEITLRSGGPMNVVVGGVMQTVSAGHCYRIRREDSEWGQWQEVSR